MNRPRPYNYVHRGIDLSGLHKQHYVCFECRRQFRLPGSEGGWRRDWNTQADDLAWTWKPVSREAAACPQCRAPLHSIGRDFKAPRQRDRKQWLKAELLVRMGYGFDPGPTGPGERPRRLSEVVDFLRTQVAHPDKIRAATQLLREIAKMRPR
jgi:hypothetical protein